MTVDHGIVRVEYPPAAPEGFEVAQVPAAPLALFTQWLAAAGAAGLAEPNAAALATADEERMPALRTVLIKVADDRGFGFFTNHSSRKGRHLAANPGAALLFGWHSMHRQVSVRGSTQRMTRAETEAYFATRPRGAQVGAWASCQSEETTREALEEQVVRIEQRFAGADIPAPPFWGGYVLVPRSIEFWVGRASRLHDRIEYVRVGPGGMGDAAAWRRRQLSP